jgi:hypothetical protein
LNFAYSAFGLLLHSNVTFPGVPLAPLQDAPSNSSRQVLMHLAVAPYKDAAESPRERELAYASAYTDEAGEPVLHIWKAADASYLRLAYCDGTQFWIDRSRQNVFSVWPENLTLENALSYLLGPVFGLLLRLRGVTCLHASAVAFGDCCAVFVGAQGAGKSTTAAAFAKRGHAVLCDDIVALDLEDAGGGASLDSHRTGEHSGHLSSATHHSGPVASPSMFRVLPAYPHLFLWPEAAKFLFGSEELFPRLAPEWEKRKLALGTSGTRFESRALPLAAIYVFGARAAENAPRIEPAPRKDSLLSLLANTYASNLLEPGMRAEEFAVLDRLLATVPVRSLTAHCDPAYIDQLCNLIDSDVQRLPRG